jgi:hypothetical protein
MTRLSAGLDAPDRPLAQPPGCPRYQEVRVDDEQDDTAYRLVVSNAGQPAAPSRVCGRPSAARPPLTGTGS